MRPLMRSRVHVTNKWRKSRRGVYLWELLMRCSVVSRTLVKSIEEKFNEQASSWNNRQKACVVFTQLVISLTSLFSWCLPKKHSSLMSFHRPAKYALNFIVKCYRMGNAILSSLSFSIHFSITIVKYASARFEKIFSLSELSGVDKSISVSIPLFVIEWWKKYVKNRYTTVF